MRWPRVAGFEPQVSLVLKKIRGIAMPLASQFSPSEIKLLSEAGINPIIDPSLIEGRASISPMVAPTRPTPSLLFIRLVRVLDDIEFR